MFRINLLILIVMLLLTARAGAAELIWQEVREPQARSVDNFQRQYQVDSPALRATLQRVTEEIGPGSVQIIRLPMPDGSLADFEIYESPIMTDALAQRYPEIKTYQVYGIDDPSASGRLDMTPRGFHAMLYTSQGRLFIDPHTNPQQSDRYQARTRNSSTSSGYSCGVDGHDMPAASRNRSAARTSARIPNRFLQYRLAVAATDEYVAKIFNPVIVGETPVEQAYTEIITAINRVNEIYRRDLGINLQLVSSDRLIENGNNIFSDNNAFVIIDENQEWIDTQLGSGNYDIGHVFSTGSGGLALLGSVCESGSKAMGVSGIADPTGDRFYIDFVSHEIGHQFNADHSFNGTSVECGPARNQATAYEPGSGSTIMSYTNICGVENLQTLSDATFHAGSIAQINSYTNAGGSCSTTIDPISPNPNEPVISAIADRTIPANTAFVLDAMATDEDPGQTLTLTYQWDQLDAGCPTDASSFGTDTGFNALFRTYVPRSDNTRHFPALGTQVRGFYDDAEVLPCNNRDVNFRLTVRDQFSGQDTADLKLSVVDTGAAFEILNLNTGGTTIVNPAPVTVNWRVAGTDQPPINCNAVDIDLLTFDDAMYTRHSVHSLAAGLPNVGTADVLITPNDLSHPRARIRVKCSNNIFYDVSNVDFAVDGTPFGPGVFDDDDNPTFFNDNRTNGGTAAPACGAVVECQVPDPGEPDSGGSGNGDASAADYRWLLFLGGFLLFAHKRRARGVN